MHTITSLRKTLDLSTTNQVRNRIEAIKDVLSPYLRRGPNNQILLTDEAVECLRELQELYDSGLTMAEASEILRAKAYKKGTAGIQGSDGFVPYSAIPNETDVGLATLREQVATLRERVASLEGRLESLGERGPDEARWWESLREDVDGP